MQIDKRKVRAAYLNKLKDSWQKYNSWLENASSPVLIERCREIDRKSTRLNSSH